MQRGADEQQVGYARAMPSASKPPTLLPTGRMKWLWLAIAGALGLWLIALLLMSGSEGPAAEQRKTPFDNMGRKPKGFDTPAAEAFSNAKRPPVKSAKPLAPFPVAPDQGKRE
jgi:hypothetical protein